MAEALAEDGGAMQSLSQIANACIHLAIVRPGNSERDDCQSREAEDNAQDDAKLFQCRKTSVWTHVLASGDYFVC